MSSARCIEKARQSLAIARLMLDEDHPADAGRYAYMAAFHAAQAFIFAHEGKIPKTHSGTRSEFARLARSEPPSPRHTYPCSDGRIG